MFQPEMVDFIETSGNIALENPFCSCMITQHDVYLFDGIGAGAFFPEPVGVWVCLGLCDGVECVQI